MGNNQKSFELDESFAIQLEHELCSIAADLVTRSVDQAFYPLQQKRLSGSGDKNACSF